MSEIAISVCNVGKCYRVFDNQRSRLIHAVWPRHTAGMQEVWALKDINFEIKRGEAVAIIGRNGGGKSTLLEILTGTLTPTTGSVKVNGRVSALLELGSGFNPEYSGRDNVILNGLLLGLSRDDITARFDEIEAFAEIGIAIDRPVKTYSSGMTMRLAFAVQVLCDPDILIIDEALSVGDFFFQQKCLSYIRTLRERSVTLIFVSHDMGTVRDICDRGIFLNEGLVEFDGDNHEAIRKYLNAASIASSAEPKEFTHGKLVGELSESLSFQGLKKPVWTAQIMPESETLEKLAYTIAVGLYDDQDNPITSILMNSKVNFRVHYASIRPCCVHVHIVVKNKYDQIVTAIGSHNLKLQPPSLSARQQALFELTIQLALEAGEYIFGVSLTQPFGDGIGGRLIDESAWIGPFQVKWNYNADVPPFYGQVGLNSVGKFVF